jgi:hypothetical protein
MTSKVVPRLDEVQLEARSKLDRLCPVRHPGFSGTIVETKRQGVSMPGFWTGGAEALRAALQKDFDERLAALSAELRFAASQEEAEAIRQRIAELRANFRGSVWQLDYLFF